MNYELRIKNANCCRNGFSLIEAILSVALFALLVTALSGAIVYGQESLALSGTRARAVFLAEEGLEVARNIRDQAFANLTNGNHGLAIAGNQWVFSGVSDATGIFTRQITITAIDPNRKQVASRITWQQNTQRSGDITLVTYLTNWR